MCGILKFRTKSWFMGNCPQCGVRYKIKEHKFRMCKKIVSVSSRGGCKRCTERLHKKLRKLNKLPWEVE